MELDKLRNELKETIYSKYKHEYVKIPDESLDIIYNLYVKDIIGTPKTVLENLYFMIYYIHKKNLIEIEKYFQNAININKTEAMNKFIDFKPIH